MSRRTSKLGRGWELRPHQLDLTCVDQQTGVPVPVVQIKYGPFGTGPSDVTESPTADEVLANLRDNEADRYIDVQVLMPGEGLRQVRHDPVGADGRRMGDKAGEQDGVWIKSKWHEVVRYRGVIDCPGCGKPIDYRVEKLVRLVWRVYGRGKHSMPHLALAGALERQTGAEH